MLVSPVELAVEMLCDPTVMKVALNVPMPLTRVTSELAAAWESLVVQVARPLKNVAGNPVASSAVTVPVEVAPWKTGDGYPVTSI